MTITCQIAKPQQNPFEIEKARLLERIALIVAPKAIRIFPTPDDFMAARDFLRELAEVIDDTIEAIGFEVADNSPYNVDQNSFNAVMSGAVADAAYECERIGERMIEDRDAA